MRFFSPLSIGMKMKLCDTYGMLLGIIVTEILDLADFFPFKYRHENEAV